MSAASSGVYDDVGAGVHGGLAPTSFAALYREHAAFTWAVLRRLGVQPAAIDDAMQELWVTAHRRLATLHGPTAARAWLYGIARRVVSHQRRTEQRHRRKIDALEHAVTPDPDRTDVAGSLVVESILAGLDDRVREAFVLSELEGWTAAEIAKATGANANTVSWRVRVAKQELRERFADDARAGAAVIDLRERTKASKRVTQHCWLSIAPAVGKAAAAGGTVAVTSFGALKLAAIAATLTVAAGLAIEAARPAAPERGTSSSVEPVGHGAVAVGGVDADQAPAIIPAVVASPVDPSRPPVGDLDPPRRAGVGRSAAPTVPPPPSPSNVDAAQSGSDAMDPDDVAMLSRAQQALQAGRLDEADAELREHRRRFPGSRLADLRELVELSLLCRSGRREDARRRIDAALAQTSSAARRAKLESTCPE